MELFIWSLIFIVSLAALVKAAAWIAASVQKLIRGDSKSSFAIAVIAAVLPEMAAAVAAVLQARPELAIAIIIGSSLANILLVVGISVVAAKSLSVKESYLESDVPFFVAAGVLFYSIVRGGYIDFFGGLLFLLAFLVYAVFGLAVSRRNLTPRDIITPAEIGSGGVKLMEIAGTRIEKFLDARSGKDSFWKAAAVLLGGTALLLVAAYFTVDSLVYVSDLLWVSATAMAMVILAAGAATPELLSNLAVIRKKQYEMALGNVFAATTANLLLAAGAAAMFSFLPLDGVTASVGLPFLIAASGLLVVTAFGRKINIGQGMMFLLLYFLFIAKVFNLF